ncbi:carbonic anhydrase 1-like [Musca autumnalis]|uniref:carbonic anhydrase 1-like n=1 Tax=Musca autumnalis TaxID=221902 RepID=UPI003CEF68B5
MVPLRNFLTINVFQLTYFLILFWISYSLGDFLPKKAQCVGKHNIPLDEKSVQVKVQIFKPFRFENLDAVPVFAELVNVEGQLYIMFEYSLQQPPIMYDGPREEYGNYSLQFIFWRWLEKSQPENDLDGIQFPAEFHLLFSNTKDKDSVWTALAFSFKVVKKSPMAFFDIITQHLPLIRTPGAHIKLPPDSIHLLAQILNGNLSDFYTYNGRTCYTMCPTDVVWFDIITPIEIGIDFVQQVEYLEMAGGKPLMTAIWNQKSPNGIVLKSFGEQQFILAPELFISSLIVMIYGM